MDKREKFLSLLSKIEPRINTYLKYLDSKIIRVFLVREKSFLKFSAILMKNILGIDLKKKVKTFWGREMNVYLSDADASSLYFFGTLCGDEIKIIKFLIKNLKENDVFYDVGANYGFYTLLATEFITKGEIHSFEPNPKIFKLLKENSFDNNIFLNEVALSYQTGEAEFYNREVVRHSGGSSLIKHFHFKKYKTIKVKTIKLDEYILNHKPATIIKIDVEGGESLVLRGASILLKKYNPTIIMEFFKDDLHKEAVNILLKNDYEVFRIDNDGNLISINEKDLLGNDTHDIFDEANYVFKKLGKNENLHNYKK